MALSILWTPRMEAMLLLHGCHFCCNVLRLNSFRAGQSSSLRCSPVLMLVAAASIRQSRQTPTLAFSETLAYAVRSMHLSSVHVLGDMMSV